MTILCATGRVYFCDITDSHNNKKSRKMKDNDLIIAILVNKTTAYFKIYI